MSERQLIAMLPHMMVKHDKRLNQYLAFIYERGFSLREIGAACDCSHETIRTRIFLAKQEQKDGFYADLSDLPDVAILPKWRNRSQRKYLSADVIMMLRQANLRAQNYRKGQDDTMVKVFNLLVEDLVAAGVPFATIADAVGQDPHHLRRRLQRWEAYPTKRRRRTKLVQVRDDLPDITTSAIPQYEPPVPCKWPDCPSHSGGKCIHQ
jgi:hypothetical protein